MIITIDNTPLNLERILAAAQDVIRRFGPEKATVVDVARALGVSHAAVYQHVASKAELRDLVVQRWMDAAMSPLRTIVDKPGRAPQRLRKFFDKLMETKRRRATEDPEVFAAYRALASGAQSVVDAHVEELVALTAAIIRAGVAEKTFRKVDPVSTGRALLAATARFHHPVHAKEWTRRTIDAEFDDVWELLMAGLCVDRTKRRS